jgi:hypothetical protein
MQLPTVKPQKGYLKMAVGCQFLFNKPRIITKEEAVCLHEDFQSVFDLWY